MKTRLLIAAFIAALSASFAAVAADAPAMDAAAEKAPVAKKKVKPHSHAEANKQGAPAPDKAMAPGEAKKPLHDHLKEHKQ